MTAEEAVCHRIMGTMYVQKRCCHAAATSSTFVQWFLHFLLLRSFSLSLFLSPWYSINVCHNLIELAVLGGLELTAVVTPTPSSRVKKLDTESAQMAVSSLIVFPASFSCLAEVYPQLEASLPRLRAYLAVIHHILQSGWSRIPYTLHLVQVVDTWFPMVSV